MTESELVAALTTPSGESRVTWGELALVGAAVLNAVGTTMTLGHERPGALLDYLPRIGEGGRDDWPYMFVLDFIAWTARRDHLRPGCAERARDFVTRIDWQRQQFSTTADLITPTH